MVRRALRLVLPAMLALVVLGAAVPASAKAPLKETFVNEGIFTLPDIDCGTFMLTEVMDSESVQVTTFFDKAGDPIKVATRANFFGTITNSASGNTYRDHASFTETINVPKGTTTVNGVSYHYTVAGQGQVFAEIGHKVMVTETGEVIFQGGQDDLAADPDLVTLCDWLV
jgi:hypothetical protein